MCEMVEKLYNKHAFEAIMPTDVIGEFEDHLKNLSTETNIRIGSPDRGPPTSAEMNVRVWCRDPDHHESLMEKAKDMGSKIMEEATYSCIKLGVRSPEHMKKWIDEYNLSKGHLKNILSIRKSEEGGDGIYEVYSEAEHKVMDLIKGFDLQNDVQEECMSVGCGGNYKGLGSLRKFILDNTEKEGKHSDLKDLHSESERLEELLPYCQMSVYEHSRSGDKYIVHPPEDADHVYPNHIVKRINSYDEIDEDLIDHLREWVRKECIDSESAS